MTTTDLRVLVIGFDPLTTPGVDAGAVEAAFEASRDAASRAGVILVECLVAPDAQALATVEQALGSQVWDSVVIGGGIRKPEPALEFFEAIVNLVHVSAAGAAIAFNTSPADSVAAAQRAFRNSPPRG